jgi:hypothetical protein
VEGVSGRPDVLFEEYTHVALQFLLADRVIRYGQERRGEAVPDGIAFAQGQAILPYDAKAYAGGYEVSRDSVRQFGDYVWTWPHDIARILAIRQTSAYTPPLDIMFG